MSTLNFDVFWRDRGAAKGLQTLSKEAENTHKSFEKVTKSTSGFGSLTGLAFKAAGVAAVGYGLKVASANEQAKISFTTMLGSAQKADVFLKQLQQFAATTPFEFPELQTAAQSLISAGIQANKVIPIMRTLGDVTAGMGTGSEGIKRATVAIQQMNAAGKITAEDLNQLRDAGIPVYDLLAAATHKSTAEVTAMAAAGKLGRKELDQLMTALESGKGLEKFNGLMEQQSKSLAGMVSTLKDVSSQMLAGWLEPLFPALKASVGALADMSSGTKTTLAIIGGSAAVMGIAAKGALGLAGAFRTLGLSANVAKFAVGGVGAVLGIASLAFGIYASEHAKAKARTEEFTQALQGEEDAVRKASAAVAAKQLADEGALDAVDALGLSMEDVVAAALGQAGAMARIQPLLDDYVAAGVDGSIADQDRATAAGELSDALKIVGGAHGKATTESKQLTEATEAGEKALGGMEKKTVSATDALEAWRIKMLQSAHAALGLMASQDDVEAAIDNVTESVKENGKTLDKHTDKGRNNRAALRELANTNLSYIETLRTNKASTEKMDKATDNARESFIKAAIKITGNRKEAEKLADKYGLLDRKINDLNDKKVTTKLSFTASLSNQAIAVRVKRGTEWMGGPSGIGPNVDPVSVSHHRPGPFEGGGVVHPDIKSPYIPTNVKQPVGWVDNIVGRRVERGMIDLVKKSLDTGPTGSVGSYSAGMAGTIARLRAAGARSFTTYPGHHPSMAKARDVTPPSWRIANTARASSGVWYVIYNMRIASKNHGNTWRQYIPHNHHGDWQHRRHVHVAWYDKGGLVPPGGIAMNGTRGYERMLSPAQTRNYDRNGGGNTYIINATHYSDAQALKTALVNLDRQGGLAVIKR